MAKGTGRLHPPTMPAPSSSASRASIPAQEADGTRSTTVKAEEVELSPSLLAGDGTADTLGAAASCVGGGRSKRKGRAPPSATSRTFSERAVPGKSSSGPSRGKRYRRALDDDEVVVLETDDRAAASGEKPDAKAGASVAIKPER